MSKELVIRPSTVGSYMLCGGRPGYRGHDDGYNYYPNEALLFGSAMHFEIENRLIGNPLSMGELEVELHAIFIKDVPDTISAKDLRHLSKVTTKAQRQQIVREVRKAVDQWEIEVMPAVQEADTFLVEETLSAVAGEDHGYRVVVRGTPDLVVERDDKITIVDWKSAGRMWKPDKAEGQIQPIAYPWMYEEVHGKPVQTFVFWVYDRSAEMWASFPVSVNKNPQRIGAFRLQAVNAAINIENGTWTWTPAGQGFKSRGWHCSPRYCDAWSVCWGKHLVNDGQADLPAPTMRERFE